MAERVPVPAELAARIKLVLLDVDGVLTDGGVYVGETASGEAVELKRFDIIDQLGMKMMEWAGITVAIVSGRVSPATRLRAEELGVECAQSHGGYKLEAAQEMVDRIGVEWSETAMVGDDLPDAAIFKRCGLPVTVANATAEVRAMARWCCSRNGGRGAVREFAEALLRARGEWNGLVQRYLVERDPEHEPHVG